MSSIRGNSGRVKFLRKGQDMKIINVLSFDVNMDSSFTRSFYVGEAVSKGDQSIEGWSGNAELEVSDASVDDLIDAIISQNLSGIGVEDIVIVLDENYPDGRLRSYAYYDVQVRMSKRVAGQTEKQTKRLDFQAAGRIPL